MTDPSLRTMKAEENQFYFRKADFFKLYLIAGVLLTHSLNYEAYGLTLQGGFGLVVYRLELFWLTLSGLIIPSFFLISAFSFMLDYRPEKALPKLKRRITTLFLPWLLWNTIMWLLSIALEHIPVIAARLNSGFGFELSLRSWLVDGLLLPANGPFWFLSNLMVALLAAPLLYPILKRRWACLVLLAMEFLAVLIIDNSAFHVRASRYSLLMSLLFFTEAAFLALHYPGAVSRTYSKRTRFLALGILLVYILLGSNSETQDGGIRHALAFSISCPALWVVVGNVKLSPWEKAVDKYRFWVYASHYLPLECVEKIWLILAGSSAGAALIGWLFSPVVTTVLLIVCASIVEKLCFPLWCVLTGLPLPCKTKTT